MRRKKKIVIGAVAVIALAIVGLSQSPPKKNLANGEIERKKQEVINTSDTTHSMQKPTAEETLTDVPKETVTESESPDSIVFNKFDEYMGAFLSERQLNLLYEDILDFLVDNNISTSKVTCQEYQEMYPEEMRMVLYAYAGSEQMLEISYSIRDQNCGVQLSSLTRKDLREREKQREKEWQESIMQQELYPDDLQQQIEAAGEITREENTDAENTDTGDTNIENEVIITEN